MGPRTASLPAEAVKTSVGRREAHVELLGEGSQEDREAVDVETAGEGAEQRAGGDHPPAVEDGTPVERDLRRSEPPPSLFQAARLLSSGDGLQKQRA